MSCRERIQRHLHSEAFVTKTEDYDNTCLVNYTDRSIQDEVEGIVDCDEMCTVKGDYESEEYKECVEHCKDEVSTSVVGSLLVDKNTLSIKESTIPISCSSVGMVEQAFLETEAPSGSAPKTKQLENRLDRIDCTEMDIGWMHPHEFLPEAAEWEEEPAVCYLHIRAKGLYEVGHFASGCKLPDVARTLWNVKEPGQQTLVLATERGRQ